MVGSANFQAYQSSLQRVLFAEMLDNHHQRQHQRRLSIVGPCRTHEQWLAVQAQRRQMTEAAKASDALSS